MCVVFFQFEKWNSNVKAVVQTTGACVKLMGHVTLLRHIKTFEGVKDCEDSVRGLCRAEETNIYAICWMWSPFSGLCGLCLFREGAGELLKQTKKTTHPKIPQNPRSRQDFLSHGIRIPKQNREMLFEISKYPLNTQTWKIAFLLSELAGHYLDQGSPLPSPLGYCDTIPRLEHCNVPCVT